VFGSKADAPTSVTQLPLVLFLVGRRPLVISMNTGVVDSTKGHTSEIIRPENQYFCRIAYLGAKKVASKLLSPAA